MLAWADACLVAFSTSDRSSFDALESIKTKVERYKRGTEVPCIFVAVSGLNGQDVAAGEGSAGSADSASSKPAGTASAFETDIEAFNRVNPALFQANPMTGNGVSIVFEKLVQQVFEKVRPSVCVSLTPVERLLLLGLLWGS